MSSWVQEAKSLLAALERRLAAAPTPMNQKVILWVLALAALGGLFGFLFLR
jgi:hypothetical protein